MVAGTGFGSSHAYDSASNRVTDTGFGYDGSGNLTSKGPGTSYSYSMENLMLSFGASVTYAYDAEGRRVRKTVGECQQFLQPWLKSGNAVGD